MKVRALLGKMILCQCEYPRPPIIAENPTHPCLALLRRVISLHRRLRRRLSARPDHQRDTAQDHYSRYLMAFSNRYAPSRLAAIRCLRLPCCLLVASIGIAFLSATTAPAQQGEAVPLRLSGVTPGGIRMTA